jgi:hypothetical protein
MHSMLVPLETLPSAGSSPESTYDDADAGLTL